MSKPIKNILRKGVTVKVNGSIWLECDGQPFFGPGPVELLELIAVTGSISQAARKMNMSYKKAWGIINRLNENAETPLVVTSPGGQHGGGSSVSEEAKDMILFYQRLRSNFLEFLTKQTAKFT